MKRKKLVLCFFFQAEDGIRDYKVTGVQTCALPISRDRRVHEQPAAQAGERPYQRTLHGAAGEGVEIGDVPLVAVEEVAVGACEDEWIARRAAVQDRKSTRLNSSHLVISYAVFCLKKK